MATSVSHGRPPSAFACGFCGDSAELQRVARALDQHGIENTGVKFDATLQREYVAFKDPDGVKWELYMA